MVGTYEIELRASLWNRVRIEPCIFRLSKLLPTIAARLKDGRAIRQR